MDQQYMIFMYSRGDDIENMAYELDLTEDQVLDALKEFKKENTVKRRMNDELKTIISNRFVNSEGLISPFNIEKELGMGAQSATRVLKKFGVIDKNYKRKAFSEREFAVIDHNRFDKCPDCNSGNVVSVHSEIKNSLCQDCWTEWYKEDGTVRKVLYHELA